MRPIDQHAVSRPDPPVGEAWAHRTSQTLARAELRAEIAAELGQGLGPKDVGAMVAIGLLGAIPLGTVARVPPELATIFSHGTNLREHLVTQVAGGISGRSLRSAIEVAGQHAELGWITSLLGGAVDAGVVPDLEDGFDVLATKQLTDRWMQHRGWSDGQRPFHQAKALAYAVNAGVGAFFNPDPLTFGLAIYHTARMLRASRAISARLRALLEASLAEADAAMNDYQGEVRRSHEVAVARLDDVPFGVRHDGSAFSDEVWGKR